MDILNELKEYRGRLEAAITVLQGPRRYIRRKRSDVFLVAAVPHRKGKRRLSAAARRRISQAARARWAKAKRAGKNSL
jgi:hypothetical protein